MSSKNKLALGLRRYILHGLLIHQRSSSPAYRTMNRAMAMDRLLPLAQPEVQLHYSGAQLALVVLNRRHDLENILPVTGNASYRSSLLNLEQLLQLAQSILPANINDTSFHTHSTLCPPTFKKGSQPLE